MDQWYILDRDGKPESEHSLPPRPEDANTTDGQNFRPWYKLDEHLHIENGKINGIHAHGSLDAMQSRLKKYIELESKIIEKFGGSEDLLLPDVDAYIGSNE